MADDEAQVSDSNVASSAALVTLSAEEKLFLSTVAKGQAAPLKRLIDGKANVNVSSASKGLTALHITAGSSDAEGTKMLLEADANVCAATKMGMLPLHFAADRDSTEIVEMLLAKPKAKAKINEQDEARRPSPAPFPHRG